MVIASLIRAKLGFTAEKEYREASQNPRSQVLKIPPDKLAVLNAKWSKASREQLDDSRGAALPAKDASPAELLAWRRAHPECAALALLYRHCTGNAIASVEDRAIARQWFHAATLAAR